MVAVAVCAGTAWSQPSQVGQWSSVVTWPQAPVHLVLQPDGTVLMWPAACSCVPGAELDGGEDARVWNPTTNTFTRFPITQTQTFCAGHVPLADGRTLVVGGHDGANFYGLPDTNVWNPTTRTWTRVADMAYARWYPTATRLPDGRVLAVSGAITPGSNANVPEVYDPVANTWTALTSASRANPLYSFLFVLPDGTVLNAGPDISTRRLNVATRTWTTVGNSIVSGHSAVMYAPGRIMKSGTLGDPDFPGPSVDARTVVVDMNAPSPAWRQTASMAFPRAYHNLVLLPDGTVLAVGGERTTEGRNVSQAVYAAEIWNPVTETWRTVASMQRARLYHSTALLLPDGRVVSAGGEFPPYLEQNAQIYSPPYLFNGARPTVTSTPAAVAYGSPFLLGTPDAATARTVSAIALGAPTHGFDQNQRYLSLAFASTTGGLTVQAPANANLAPPGDYLVFLVSTSGVPSIGRVVRFGPGGGTTTSTTLSPVPTTSSTSTSSSTTQPPPGTTSTTLPPGLALAAAYGFEEGSGTVTVDASGNANHATLVNATWSAAGRFGGALAFAGGGSYLRANDAGSLDIGGEFTLMAWINPSAVGGYRVVVDKTTNGQPCNYYMGLLGDELNFGFFNAGWREHTTAAANVPTNAWTHVAVVYSDAENVARAYVNGMQELSEPETTSLVANSEQLRIGIGGANEGFAGRVDEVRVYRRVLSQAEIQADMAQPVLGGGPTTSTTSSTTSTTASSTSSLPPSTSSSTSTSTTTSVVTSTTGAAPSTTSTSSSSSSSASTSSTSTSSTSTSSTSSSSVTSSTAAPGSTTTTTVPPGLVAAYAFDEGAGTTAADASGRGHTGVVSGAAWTAAGRYGGALDFDGQNDWVTVADAAELDLTAGMTLEAWVYPTAAPINWRQVVAKEGASQMVYFLHAGSGGGNLPATGVWTGGVERTLVGGTPLVPDAWVHVAATYDGARQRLYVNGTEVANRAQTGSILTSTGPLRVGGNGVWGEFFAGRIDEVRVYDRALTPQEIQADLARPVAP
jgi:hypothetical protein